MEIAIDSRTNCNVLVRISVVKLSASLCTKKKNPPDTSALGTISAVFFLRFFKPSEFRDASHREANRKNSANKEDSDQAIPRHIKTRMDLTLVILPIMICAAAKEKDAKIPEYASSNPIMAIAETR